MILVQTNSQWPVIAPRFCTHVAILPGIDAMSFSGFGYKLAKRVRRARKVVGRSTRNAIFVFGARGTIP